MNFTVAVLVFNINIIKSFFFGWSNLKKESSNILPEEGSLYAKNIGDESKRRLEGSASCACLLYSRVPITFYV